MKNGVFMSTLIGSHQNNMKRPVFAHKLMLCIWWNEESIIYYELLLKNLTNYHQLVFNLQLLFKKSDKENRIKKFCIMTRFACILQKKSVWSLFQISRILLISLHQILVFAALYLTICEESSVITNLSFIIDLTVLSTLYHHIFLQVWYREITWILGWSCE